MHSVLACPHCRGQVTISTEFAGQTLGCPHCGRPFVVPAAPATPPVPPPQLPAETPRAAPIAVTRDTPRTANCRTNMILGAVGLGLVIVAFFCPTLWVSNLKHTFRLSFLDLLQKDIGGHVFSSFSASAVLLLVAGVASSAVIVLKRFRLLFLTAAGALLALALTFIEYQSLARDVHDAGKKKPIDELFVGRDDGPTSAVKLDFGLAIALVGGGLLLAGGALPVAEARVRRSGR